jgi:hypothetical protein
VSAACSAMTATGICGAKKSHSIHVLALGREGAHQYQDGTRAGLSPIGKARERFNESERGKAYNEVTRALRAGETACQIQSPVCTGIAQHQDEALPRGRAGGIAASLRDGPAPYLACDACNAYLAENLTWAAEHGFARLKAKGSR